MERLKHIKDSLMCCVEGQMGNLSAVDTHELGAAIDMIKDLEEAIYYCTITKAMTEQEEEKKMMMMQKKMNGGGNGEEMYYTEMYYPPYAERQYMNGGGGGQRQYSNGGGGQRQYMDGGNQRQYMDNENQRQYMENENQRQYAEGGGNSSSSGGGRQGGGGGGRSSYSENNGRQYYADGNNNYGNPKDNEKEGRSGRSRRQYMESRLMHQDTATQMRELEKYMKELSSDILEMIEEASPEERQFLSKKIATLATKVDAVE